MQFDAKISVKQAPVGISRLVICRLEEFHPHPSYVRCHLDVSPSQLSTLAELGDLAFRDPIVVTQDKKILDGYARVKLAQLQGRPTLECFQYELTELEALHFLLQRRRRSEGLNDYCRILLALELEPLLSEKARFNQQVGGLKKGSANLTKAERIDVRKQTAVAANVSVGNVTKVKQIIKSAHWEIQQAARTGEVSINQACLWSNEPCIKQREDLWLYRTRRGVNRDLRAFISKHQAKDVSPTRDLGSFFKRLSALTPSDLSSVGVLVAKIPGKVIVVTEELDESLPPYQEAIEICAPNNL